MQQAGVTSSQPATVLADSQAVQTWVAKSAVML